MSVRTGTVSDFGPCVVMAARFWQASGYASEIPFDADSALDYFQLGLNSGLFAVAEKDGRIIGFVIGAASPCMVNRNYKVAAEMAWWMEPEYRNGPDGIRLLKHIEKLAQESGCKIWSMMCLESLEPEKVESMYLRMGYKPAERTFARIF